MKIAILSRYQNRVNRGVESVVFELSKRLSKTHQVDVISGDDSDNLNLILHNNYQIIMPMNGRLQSLKVSLGRFFKNYKLVIGGHSGIGKDEYWNIIVAKPDLYIALTNFMADWVRKWAWGSKVVKINNGVDLEKFNPAGKKFHIDLPRPMILSVGTLEWYKHHERTIEALSLLNIGSLLIIGSGSQKDKLNELGNRKLKNRFKIIKASYDEMPEIYRSCDLFTLPSWNREAFGVVYLEALASGLGVVAPDDLSRREIVGNAGLFADLSNPENFAAAIDHALKTNWRNLPRNQATKFSWDIVAKEYQKCFENQIN